MRDKIILPHYLITLNETTYSMLKLLAALCHAHIATFTAVWPWHVSLLLMITLPNQNRLK